MPLPSFALAVILTFPFFYAVTFPFEDTVAIFLLLEVQVSSLLIFLAGVNFAFMVVDFPFFNVVFPVSFIFFTAFFIILIL